MAVKLNGPASGLDPKAKDGDVLAYNRKADQWLADATVKERLTALENTGPGGASAASPLAVDRGRITVEPGTADNSVLRWDATKKAWVQDPGLHKRLTDLEAKVAALPKASRFTGPDHATYGDFLSSARRMDLAGGYDMNTNRQWLMNGVVATHTGNISTIRLATVKTTTIGNNQMFVYFYGGPDRTNMPLLANGIEISRLAREGGVKYFAFDRTISIVEGQFYAAMIHVRDGLSTSNPLRLLGPASHTMAGGGMDGEQYLINPDDLRVSAYQLNVGEAPPTMNFGGGNWNRLTTRFWWAVA